MDCAELKYENDTIVVFTRHWRRWEWNPQNPDQVGCPLEHYLVVKSLPDGVCGTVSAVNNERNCIGTAILRNLKGNGPEDARIVMDSKSPILVYPDYHKNAKCKGAYARGQYIQRAMKQGGSFSFGKPVALQVPSGEICLEKNWMPFVYNDKFFAARWLMSYTNTTEIHQYDTETGSVKESWHTDASWLGARCPGIEKLRYRGGTPFVRFNSSHYIGAGHLGKFYLAYMVMLEMKTMSITAVSNFYSIDVNKTMIPVKDCNVTEWKTHLAPSCKVGRNCNHFNFFTSIRLAKQNIMRATIGIGIKQTRTADVNLGDLKWFDKANVDITESIEPMRMEA